MADTRPVLYVVGCGGRPAGHLPAFVRFAQGQGWDVCVIATPDGAKFLDAPDLAGLTGHPVRVRYKRPEEPDVLPPPDAFVIAPATFNTINKLAHGISDTLALGLLNEAIGLGLPIIAVPWPKCPACPPSRIPAQRACPARMGREGDSRSCPSPAGQQRTCRLPLGRAARRADEAARGRRSAGFGLMSATGHGGRRQSFIHGPPVS